MNELTDEQIDAITSEHWGGQLGASLMTHRACIRAGIAADRALRASPPGDAAMPVICYQGWASREPLVKQADAQAALAEREAENAALKTSLAAIRDCFPVPAHGSELEDAWSEAMGAPEGIAAYVTVCVAAQANEIAALKAQRMAYASEFSLNADGEPDTGSIHANIRAVKAEIAALRQDALRYRDLRKAAVYGLPSCEGSSQKQAFLVITGYGDDESADLTDQAVDAEIAQAVQPKESVSQYGSKEMQAMILAQAVQPKTGTV